MMMNKKGQSSIEFIVVFTFAIGFFVIFLGLGINLTLGYLVHYGTFDASRVYLVQDGSAPTVSTSEQFARNKVNNNLKAIKNYTWDQVFSDSQFGMENASGFQFNKPGSVIAEYIGVYFRYKKKLSNYAILTGSQKVEYVSESFLGKEPVRAECRERVCSRMQGGCDNSSIEVTAFDNGC